MALYSWFLKVRSRLKTRKTKINNDLQKASESIKHLKNFTMWPMASIKKDVIETFPINTLNTELPKEQTNTIISKQLIDVK